MIRPSAGGCRARLHALSVASATLFAVGCSSVPTMERHAISSRPPLPIRSSTVPSDRPSLISLANHETTAGAGKSDENLDPRGALSGGATQTLPIDLPTALRLGDANNLEIALAREQINAALARLEGAEVLWLPSLQAGSAYLRHDGQIQRSTGEIIDTRRNSLFVGGGPVLSVDLADAIYEPLVARQVLRADSAAAEVSTNNTLLQIAEGYLDLLAAQASIAIAAETRGNAAELARLTGEFEKQGAGLPSDAARAQTELGTRDQQVIASNERLVVASASLAQLLRLDPQVQLAPLEPNAVPIELTADDRDLRDLVAHALEHRPELDEQQALVQASVERLREAKYGPLIPSVLLGYQSGAFGGGQGNSFGDFSVRDDFTAAAVWELRNLGFGDRSLKRLRESQLSQAQLRSLQVADRIAAEVVTAHQVLKSRRQQVEVTQRTVEAALRSYNLNMTRIRGGAGLPIEVLQSIQALDRARSDYLQAVTYYNKAQFRLLTALGNTPATNHE